MSVEGDLRARLLGDGSFHGLIADRLYPDLAPQQAPRPFVVYERTSSERPLAANGSRNMEQVRLDYTIAADSRLSATAIRDRLVAVLETLHGQRVGETSVRRTVLEDERSGAAEPTGGAEEAVYTTTLGVTVWTST